MSEHNSANTGEDAATMPTRECLNKMAEIANLEYRTDEIEIDKLQGDHDLSLAPDEGVWVRAWVFLSLPILDAHEVNARILASLYEPATDES